MRLYNREWLKIITFDLNMKNYKLSKNMKENNIINIDFTNDAILRENQLM